MSHSPLAEGLRLTVSPDVPLTTETLARAYQVSTRAIFRYKKAGVDVADPRAVASHLLRMRSPSPAALKAVTDIL